MAEVCRAVPDDFLVLSGDDAMTLPLMAMGGRGIISVASNEIPAEMAQMVEAAERGDFATARKIHTRILPLMLGNFIESNPGPVKFAMAAMGLCEEVFRLPMVSPRPASQEKILGDPRRARVCRGHGRGPDAAHAASALTPRRIRTHCNRSSPQGRAARTRRGRAQGLRRAAPGARAPAKCAPPNPTRHRRPAGASTRGSSKASCSAFASAISST